MTLIKVTSVVDIDTHKAYIHAKHVSVACYNRCSVKDGRMNNRASFWRGSSFSPIHLLLCSEIMVLPHFTNSRDEQCLRCGCSSPSCTAVLCAADINVYVQI